MKSQTTSWESSDNSHNSTETNDSKGSGEDNTEDNESYSAKVSVGSEEDEPSGGVMAIGFILAVFTVHFVAIDPIQSYPYIIGAAFWLSYGFLLNGIHSLVKNTVFSDESTNTQSDNNSEDISEVTDTELLSELYVRGYINEEELESATEVSEKKQSDTQRENTNVELNV